MSAINIFQLLYIHFRTAFKSYYRNHDSRVSLLDRGSLRKDRSFENTKLHQSGVLRGTIRTHPKCSAPWKFTVYSSAVPTKYRKVSYTHNVHDIPVNKNSVVNFGTLSRATVFKCLSVKMSLRIRSTVYRCTGRETKRTRTSNREETAARSYFRFLSVIHRYNGNA